MVARKGRDFKEWWQGVEGILKRWQGVEGIVKSGGKEWNVL